MADEAGGEGVRKRGKPMSAPVNCQRCGFMVEALFGPDDPHFSVRCPLCDKVTVYYNSDRSDVKKDWRT